MPTRQSDYGPRKRLENLHIDKVPDDSVWHSALLAGHLPLSEFRESGRLLARNGPYQASDSMPVGKYNIAAILLLTLLSQGCARLPWGTGFSASNSPAIVMPNPLPVPFYPRELVMDEVSDEVEDYFRIIKEQRVRLTGNILTEGYIDTEPKIGSTVFEPWRQDSTPGFELAHSSLQTVRRWAKVRVIPTADRYLIDVKVYKELEDLDVPLNSSVSGRSVRQDSSLGFDYEDRPEPPPNRGWIPLGRDEALEQRIVTSLAERFERAAQNGATCVR